MKHFSCPKCGVAIKKDTNNLNCPRCGQNYMIINGIPDFLGETKKNEMREFFDHASTYYESTEYYTQLYTFYGGIPLLTSEDLIDDLNNLLRGEITFLIQQEPDLVLDVACGTGMFTRSIAQGARQVYGVDISTEMLKTAQKNAYEKGLNNISFIRARAESLPFNDDIFDALTCCGGLQLFEEVNMVLKEMHRVMKNGSKLAGFTYVRRRNLQKSSVLRVLENEMSVHIFEVNELKDLIKEAGFSNYKYKIMGSIIIFGADKI